MYAYSETSCSRCRTTRSCTARGAARPIPALTMDRGEPPRAVRYMCRHREDSCPLMGGSSPGLGVADRRRLDWWLLEDRCTALLRRWSATASRISASPPRCGHRTRRRRLLGSTRTSEHTLTPSCAEGGRRPVVACVVISAAADGYRLGDCAGGPLGGGSQHRRDRVRASAHGGACLCTAVQPVRQRAGRPRRDAQTRCSRPRARRAGRPVESW